MGSVHNNARNVTGICFQSGNIDGDVDMGSDDASVTVGGTTVSALDSARLITLRTELHALIGELDGPTPPTDIAERLRGLLAESKPAS